MHAVINRVLAESLDDGSQLLLKVLDSLLHDLIGGHGPNRLDVHVKALGLAVRWETRERRMVLETDGHRLGNMLPFYFSYERRWVTLLFDFF